MKNQVSINGDVFDCSDFKNQLLSLRCMVLQSTVIEPNPEGIVPVIVQKRSCNLHPKLFQLGMRFLELCLNSTCNKRDFMLQGFWLILRRTELSIYMFSVFLMKCFTWLVRL